MVRGNVGWRVALYGLAAAALLLGCTSSKYDVKIEAAAADWQTKVTAFITDTVAKAGTTGGAYEQNKQFYEEMQTSVGGQIAQTKAGSGSQRAIDIMELLSKDIENLRKLHEAGGAEGLTKTVGDPAQAAIETEIRALNKLESEYRAGAAENG